MKCWVCRSRTAKMVDNPEAKTGRRRALLQSGPVAGNYLATDVCVSCYLSNFGFGPSCACQYCGSTAAHTLGMRGRDYPDWMDFEREWLSPRYDLRRLAATGGD